MKLKTKVWIEKDGELIFGSGKTLILKTIAQTGSINKAAEKIDMSFRRAWSYIHAIEERIGSPMVVKVKGGKHGGGAVLTAYAKELLQKFERLERDIRVFADKRFKEIFYSVGKYKDFPNRKNSFPTQQRKS